MSKTTTPMLRHNTLRGRFDADPGAGSVYDHGLGGGA
jgi:hypothetical protein